MYEPISEELNELGTKIIGAAINVHKTLGPGLLERIYEICLCHELEKMGLKVERQKYLPIIYDGIVFEEGVRFDILVEGKVVCELKAVEAINPLWKAQLLSHLRLTNNTLGYIINFNTILLKDGVIRMVNKYRK
jgi:GxxExxY protein